MAFPSSESRLSMASIDNNPENVRVIEIPVYKENFVQIPRNEIHEIETLVPVYDYQYTETVVEVPHIEVVNTEVELQQVREVTRRVPQKKIVEIQKEVMKYVPKIVTKIVEREVEVPGDVIQVPKPYKVENKIIVPRYINEDTPMVVSQLIQPIIYESTEDYLQVSLKEYQPYLVPVDIYVAVPVEREFIPANTNHQHRTVETAPPEFNALVKAANLGSSEKDVDGLLVKQIDGSIPMINAPSLRVVPPIADDWKQTHQPGQIHVEASPQSFVIPTL